jgi:hypothetical protein
MKTSVPYETIFAAFPPARRRKIKKRAAELIAEESTLRDPGKADEITPKAFQLQVRSWLRKGRSR